MQKQQAYWLDRSRVAIPPASFANGEIYAIHWSLAGGLTLAANGVTGGQQIPLQPGGSLTQDELARYPQLAKYAVLTVPSSVTVSTIKQALKGQIALSSVSPAGASHNGMSNSFPKVSPDGRWIVYVQARNGQLMRPDSQLYIVPAAGGEARRMRCNTPLMNSWHSFSPNGRWLVFSSKARSPCTQMYLTHLDEDGNDSPAILIENATAANRTVNIPEFVNVPRGGLLSIEAPAAEYYRIVDGASDLMTRKQFAAAAAEWRKALELQPGEASAHYNLGLSLFQSGRAVEAIEHYERALQLSPEYPEAHNNLGSALSSLGRLDEAILHFQKAVDLDATRTSAQTNLGTTLAQKGRFAEAIPRFEIAIQHEPDNAETQNSMGWALAVTGQLDEAMPHLERAVTAKPENPEYQLNLARILAAKSRFQEAIPHFEKAVQLSAGSEPTTLDLLAGAYSEVGRFTDAAQTVRRALAIAERQNNSQFVETLKARLACYQSKF